MRNVLSWLLTGVGHGAAQDAPAMHVGGLTPPARLSMVTLQRAERELHEARQLLTVSERLQLLQANLRAVGAVINSLALRTTTAEPLPLYLGKGSHSPVLYRARPLARNKKGQAWSRRNFLSIAVTAFPVIFFPPTRSINETQITEGQFIPSFTEGGIVSFEFTTRDPLALPGKTIIVPLSSLKPTTTDLDPGIVHDLPRAIAAAMKARRS